jgi:hypothetical protein
MGFSPPFLNYFANIETFEEISKKKAKYFSTALASWCVGAAVTGSRRMLPGARQ